VCIGVDELPRYRALFYVGLALLQSRCPGEMAYVRSNMDAGRCWKLNAESAFLKQTRGENDARKQTSNNACSLVAALLVSAG
jgi:hypothetical protein